MINWDDLRYLLASVRRGTYSGAAEELGVNRTTVARRINALETALGQQLLESSSDGLHASAAGKRLLQTASAMEKQLQASARDLDTATINAGPLRIAAPTGLGAEFMPELIQFCRLCSEIELELITVANPATLLSQRQADIGIVVSDQPPEHLKGTLLAQMQRAAYATPQYLDQYAAELPLHQHRWISWGRAMSNTLVARWMRSNLPADIDIAARVNSWTAMREAVAGGLGISYLWCFLADADPRLQQIRAPQSDLSTGLWLLHHEDVPPNQRMQAFQHTMAAPLARRAGTRNACNSLLVE